jgi:hypothetical protein
VDAISPTDAWAVGTDGLFAHWNGANWTPVDNTKLIGTSPLYSVDMLTSNQVWATSNNGRILRYNGASWVQEPTNFSTTMYDISMVSSNYGWAAGSSARFARYDGSSWTEVVPGGTLTSTIYGLDMVSTTDGWAVTGTADQSGRTGKIARFNGTTWQQYFTTNRILYDVDMLDATYGWAVGEGGTVLQWNGSVWQEVSPPPSCRYSCGAVFLYAVSVASRTNVWAVGSTNSWTNNLWHWDGTRWTEVLPPNDALLNDVVVLPSNFGLAAADRGTIFRYDGSNWTIATTQWTTNGFRGFDCLHQSDCWAVGILNQQPPAYGLQHWNGSNWEVYQPPAYQPTMYDVGMVAPDAVWAVGTSGYIFRWNGSGWTRDPSPPDAHLYAMDMVSATEGWAVGSSGRIVRFDGSAWSNYTSPTTTNLWAIDMVDANEGWAGGTLGLMLHYQNGTWTRLNPNPASYTIEGIHMLNADEGWAVGYNGTILHYQNGTWTQQASPTTANLLNVYMLNSNEGWAVGTTPTGGSATILRYINGTWSLVASPTGNPLRDLFMFETGYSWAVGEAPGAKIFLGSAPGQTPTPATPTPTLTATATRTATATATAPATATVTGTSTPYVTATPTCLPGWSIVPGQDPSTSDNTIYGLAVIAPDDIWAVGSYRTGSIYQTLVEHWDGAQWTVVPSPNVGSGTNIFLAVSAVAPNDIWAVGWYLNGSVITSLIEHWDGTAWTVVPSPNPGSQTNWLSAVHAISANDVWAVGYYNNPAGIYQTLTLHWDGTAWTVVPSPSPSAFSNGLYGVAAVAPDDIWAVGWHKPNNSTFHTLTLHWDGSAWRVVPSPNPDSANNVLYGVTVAGPDDIWAAGWAGNLTLIEHWDGTAWTVVPSPSPGSPNMLYAIDAVAPDDIWAVGNYGSGRRLTLALHWNGSAWVHENSPNAGTGNNFLYAVGGLPTGHVWAAGTYSGGGVTRTLFLRYSGSCPTPTPLPTGSPSATSSATPTRTNTPTPTRTAVGASPTSTPRVPTATPTALVCPMNFTDVDEFNPFYIYIRCLYCRGILGGYADGTFRPYNPTTRGQMAKIVSNAAGFSDPIPSNRQTFSDVPPGHTFWVYIERLAWRGIVGGYADGTFRPDNWVTRGQMAKFASNAAGFDEEVPPGTQTYTDVPPGSTFWVYIERLSGRGIISGYECGNPEPCDPQRRPYYRPHLDVTRGQTSKIVANTFFPINCAPRGDE